MSEDTQPPTARPGVKRARVATTAEEPKRQPSVLNLLSLDEVLSYEPEPGSMLCGDGIVETGETTLLFGAPGSFKGFAVGQLMACGAWGRGNWLGFDVNCRFASLWINCENGRRRLKSQFSKLSLPPDAKDYIFMTDIPAVWSLNDERLANEIRETLERHTVKLVILDTVSNFAGDEMAKDFAAFFAALNAITAKLPHKVAFLLIHHARKPKETDKGGRGLLNCISGHQTLQRRSRCIMFLGRVTEELEEKRIVSVCLKCSNNGKAEGVKSALQLGENGMLNELMDFDWKQWAAGRAGDAKEKERPVKIEHLRIVFDNGRASMSQNHAAEKLEEMEVIGRTAACNHLKVYRDEGVLIDSKSAKGFTLAPEYCTPEDEE